MGLLACLVAIPVLQAGALEDEGMAFLQRLSSQGYSVISMRSVPLTYLEPCTLAVYLPDSTGAGFFIGMGGEEILDLDLEIVGGSGWVLRDTLPDDLPVITVTPAQASDVAFAVILAADMLNDALADSALFMYALERVDLQPPTGDVPSAQDENGGSE